MNCPRCQEPLAAGQEYCLECGARFVEPRTGARHDSRTSWVVRSLLAGLVALVGAAGAVAATDGDGDSARVVTAIGGFATTPGMETQESPGGGRGSSGVTEWPTGEEGWTVVLASLPKTGGQKAALTRARRASRKDLQEVGVLDSSRYASLHPGYWVVFSGVYSSEAEATSALEDARAFARSATVRRVVP